MKIFLLIPLFVILHLNENNCEQVRLTAYHLAQEKDYKDGRDVWLGRCNGARIKRVKESFARAARLEGSAKLNDGRIVNLDYCDGRCEGSSTSRDYNCFFTPECAKGANGECLKAFTSIAIKKGNRKFPLGRRVFVKEFENLRLPSGETHNGCVQVQALLSQIQNLKSRQAHIDWYTFSKSSENWAGNRFRNVDATLRRCTLRTYKEE